MFEIKSNQKQLILSQKEKQQGIDTRSNFDYYQSTTSGIYKKYIYIYIYIIQ